jgi:hypothetical protein
LVQGKTHAGYLYIGENRQFPVMFVLSMNSPVKLFFFLQFWEASEHPYLSLFKLIYMCQGQKSDYSSSWGMVINPFSKKYINCV